MATNTVTGETPDGTTIILNKKRCKELEDYAARLWTNDTNLYLRIKFGDMSSVKRVYNKLKNME